MVDYIVVGAGSAGCVLASRLSERPGVQVLLLEAGPPDTRREIHVPAAWSKLFRTEVDWNYATEPQRALEGRALYWPRGKVLGGTSSMNAMMYVRGNRADYDEWAALGNPGWSYEEVLPHFRKAERHEAGADAYHGTDGPITVSAIRAVNPLSRAFVEAAMDAGLPRNDDINGATQEGVGFTPVTIRGGKRCSTAVAYLRPAMRRANLTVITQAQATRLLLDGRRATGVEYLRDGERHTALARREVIVSAGVVNSPQLLMLSGIGPGALLQAHGIAVACDLAGVGQHLRDHLAVAVLYRSLEPVSLTNAETLINLLRYLLARRGPYASNVAEACAFLRVDPQAPAPDLELVFGPFPYRNHNLVPPAPSDHGFGIGAVLLRPTSVGEITLRSADPTAAPRIDPHYLADAHGRDLQVLCAGIRWARRIASRAAFDRYRGEELEPGATATSEAALHAFIRRHCETLYHPVGTCRMGSDAHAVVDSRFRVRGIGGLRVVDASVMPAMIRGHPNAAVIMMAEKAADLIRE